MFSINSYWIFYIFLFISIAGRSTFGEGVDYDNLIISPQVNLAEEENHSKKYDNWTFLSQSDVENLIGFFIEPDEYGHHNYHKMTLLLKRLNLDYPDITHLYSIGKSAQGRDLWVLIISDNPKEHEPGTNRFCRIFLLCFCNNRVRFCFAKVNQNLNISEICTETKSSDEKVY